MFCHTDSFAPPLTVMIIISLLFIFWYLSSDLQCKRVWRDLGAETCPAKFIATDETNDDILSFHAIFILLCNENAVKKKSADSQLNWITAPRWNVLLHDSGPEFHCCIYVFNIICGILHEQRCVVPTRFLHSILAKFYFRPFGSAIFTPVRNTAFKKMLCTLFKKL